MIHYEISKDMNHIYLPGNTVPVTRLPVTFCYVRPDVGSIIKVSRGAYRVGETGHSEVY